MMFDVRPLHPSQPSPSQKLNRENRIKNACLSNSHSNIAASNDKRPLFVRIPATSSASLVSTSLPIQCLRLSNCFFYRGIFLNSFLRQHFQKLCAAFSALSKTFFRDKDPHSFAELTFGMCFVQIFCIVRSMYAHCEGVQIDIPSIFAPNKRDFT